MTRSVLQSPASRMGAPRAVQGDVGALLRTRPSSAAAAAAPPFSTGAAAASTAMPQRGGRPQTAVPAIAPFVQRRKLLPSSSQQRHPADGRSGGAEEVPGPPATAAASSPEGHSFGDFTGGQRPTAVQIGPVSGADDKPYPSAAESADQPHRAETSASEAGPRRSPLPDSEGPLESPAAAVELPPDVLAAAAEITSPAVATQMTPSPAQLSGGVEELLQRGTLDPLRERLNSDGSCGSGRDGSGASSLPDAEPAVATNGTRKLDFSDTELRADGGGRGSDRPGLPPHHQPAMAPRASSPAASDGAATAPPDIFASEVSPGGGGRGGGGRSSGDASPAAWGSPIDSVAMTPWGLSDETPRHPAGADAGIPSDAALHGESPTGPLERLSAALSSAEAAAAEPAPAAAPSPSSVVPARVARRSAGASAIAEGQAALGRGRRFEAVPSGSAAGRFQSARAPGRGALARPSTAAAVVTVAGAGRAGATLGAQAIVRGARPGTSGALGVGRPGSGLAKARLVNSRVLDSEGRTILMYRRVHLSGGRRGACAESSRLTPRSFRSRRRRNPATFFLILKRFFQCFAAGLSAMRAPPPLAVSLQGRS